LIVAVGSAALAGCALRDPRDDYAYSRASDGLWGDTPFELIDWNFPTSVNQGPIEAPKRIRLERTAIGVTWATRNPLPLKDESPVQDAPRKVSADDGAGTVASPPAPARADAAAGERRSVR
jgi:hypothetical protein